MCAVPVGMRSAKASPVSTPLVAGLRATGLAVISVSANNAVVGEPFEITPRRHPRNTHLSGHLIGGQPVGVVPHGAGDLVGQRLRVLRPFVGDHVEDRSVERAGSCCGGPGHRAVADIVPGIAAGRVHALDQRGRGGQLSEIEQDLERVYTLFPRLKERRGQVAGTMSGGEQQMLAIGRALMARPSLLIMDEPSMGLSPAFVDQVFDIIQEINRQGTTIFMVEQNANMALSIASRGYVLQTGEVVLSGEARGLLQNEWLRSAYLGEMKASA